MSTLTCIVPPPVRPGDRIAVIAPATPFDPDIFAAGVRQLEALGFPVDLHEDVYLATRYTSGSAAQRAAVISRSIADPSVKALVAARGGYGSVHLLPYLDVSALRDNPKRIVGCSDITTLLSFIGQRTGLVTYHGPMVAGEFGVGADDATVRDFLATMAGEVSPDKDIPLEVLAPGRAEGPLAGGCLALLCASMGTPYEFHADDAILFIEDIREHPYRIDRMVTQLLFGGKLDRVRGIVFGTMTGCEAPRGADYRLQDVLGDLLRPLGIPLYFGFPSGHAKPNLTLPIGATVRMEGGRLRMVGRF